MVQYSEPFGGRIREVLGEARQTPNSIELLSERRISHMTVRRMQKGYPPSSDLIIEFAEAIGRALEWTPKRKKELADDLLSMVESRARYFASVRRSLTAHARSVAV